MLWNSLVLKNTKMHNKTSHHTFRFPCTFTRKHSLTTQILK